MSHNESRPLLHRVGSNLNRRKGSELDSIRVVGDHYQLGAEIGRGGYGIVYSALDLHTGVSVAIKQVSLHSIDREVLSSIESEINLLRKLHHRHIVNYIDTIRTNQSLFIVLEYMEQGSLAQFIKKFGLLSETLVVMYISQVLSGLAYLHEQGVVHRDIKGANILTTKEGLVKLADFGVAIKLNETQKSHSVVGSPYWMAPEVIEMAGWSFASDIWSVGCTIIELLTTKPPYFELTPMAALFRIVQDDHPPLPEHISPALHDFIMKCFRKEPRLRSSAEELLNHPWITSCRKAKKRIENPVIKNETKKEIQEEGVENWDDEFDVESKPQPVAITKSIIPTSSFHLSTEDAKVLLSDEVWDDDDELPSSVPTPSVPSSLPPPTNISLSSHLLPAEKQQKRLLSFRETDDDHDISFDDVDEDELIHAASIARSQQMVKDSINDLFEDEEDLSCQIVVQHDRESSFVLEDDDELVDLVYSNRRDQHHKTMVRAVELINCLNPNHEENMILESCSQLEKLFQTTPSLRSELLSQPGIIPNLMEALEMTNSNVVYAVLCVINTMIQNNPKFHEHLVLAGLLPIIIRLTRVIDNDKIRMEAAQFVRYSCQTSGFTLQMFIACGGLGVLVDFLHSTHHDAFQHIALECIVCVFTLPTIAKNDICRLFVKAGLLHSFVIVFQDFLQTLCDKACLENWHTMCDIFVLFSQGDVIVKEHMCTPQVLETILMALHSRYGQEEGQLAAMVKLLKVIRNLSMEPTTLERLDHAGTIGILVDLLHHHSTNLTGIVREVENIILQSMFYLCRLNRSRQTRAAEAGIVPLLMEVVYRGSPLKQFALPILCDCTHASSSARQHLWKHKGVPMFLHVLNDKYWQQDAIKSLSVWLLHETLVIERILIEPLHLLQLVDGFQSAQDTELEYWLEPLLDMLMRSTRLNQALGQCALFLHNLVIRLQRVSTAMIRTLILKLLKGLVETHPCPSHLIIEYQLYPLIQGLIRDETSLILVNEMASQLLETILLHVVKL